MNNKPYELIGRYNISKNMIITLSILFILNVLDVISTIIAGNNGGVEVNPIALWTMQYGYLGFILFKLLGFLLVVGLTLLLSKIKSDKVNFKRALLIGINVFNAFMLYVVVHHFIGSYW